MSLSNHETEALTLPAKNVPGKQTGVNNFSQRLLSLDFLRGLIMVSLMLGETGFFQKLYRAAPGSFTQMLSVQFEHSEWHGLTCWDVILPAFMTMAGTAMAFSYKKQQQ